MTDTTDQETPFVTVHTLTSRFEGDLLLDALQQEGIPVILRSFEETPYTGLFVPQRGWGRLMVPSEHVRQAKQVLEPLVKSLEHETKRLYTDPSEVDPLLWEQLRATDPAVTSLNAQVRYDSAQEAYILPFLDTQFLCHPHRETIEPAGPADFHKLSFELHLAVLHYLLEAKPVGLSGKWISEKDIPGGQLFFRGPHRFPTEPLLQIFGARPELFSAAAEKLGAAKVRMGDLACRLWPFPRVPILFVLWKGDEEFPPEMNIRFDGSINAQIQTLDTIWALVNVVCRSLRAAGKAAAEEKA